MINARIFGRMLRKQRTKMSDEAKVSEAKYSKEIGKRLRRIGIMLRRLLRFELLLPLLAGCAYHSQQIPTASGTANPERKSVRIFSRSDGDVTRIFVENNELAEVTISFHYALTNLKSSTTLPLTATFPPNQVTEAFSVTPLDPNVPWHYTYTNYHYLGSAEAVHDDTYLYSLPYATGRAYKVSQAYGGSFSHGGANQYAIDWRMPEGTPVHAARGGLVVKTKDSSDQGGPSVAFDKFNNYVIIRHTDGTMGHYCHLQKGSVQVQEGDWVNDGDLLARSGNTGFSTGPHLHFSVFKAKSGKERVSIPVRFRTRNGATTLRQGDKYTALPSPAATHSDVAIATTEPKL